MNDLQKRLKKFAVDVYRFSLKLRQDPLLLDNVNQMIRSSASPSANYGEAQSASSRKDFHNKIRICLKEARESYNWLEYFSEIYPSLDEARPLIKEVEELCKILSSIAFKTESH